MARKESLPAGIERLPSGTLRVRLRVQGFEPVSKPFPLFTDTTDERRRQLADAKAWAEETRRKMLAGTHTSTREAEALTLGDALRRFEREGLKAKPGNRKIEGYRIRQILADPIAERPVAALRKTDIAAYRDQLIRRGRLKSVERAIARLDDTPKNRARLKELRSLEALSQQAREASDERSRARLEQRIAEIEQAEGIKAPARTTIANMVQLISRALKHAGQTIDGIPDVGGVPMPVASPGRERRVSPAELDLLLTEGAKIDCRLPLIIRFAIETALRRERLLTVRTSYLRDIGAGKRAIVFPKETAVRNKRTGIVPVTREIHAIIDDAIGADEEKVVRLKRDDDRLIFSVPVNTFASWWKRLLQATGIEDLHFHDLRHEATSRLFERGLTTAEVMSITGHSTTDMVDRYSHYSAALVHAKLERGLDTGALLEEIGFLVGQYRALSGDNRKLASLLTI